MKELVVLMSVYINDKLPYVQQCVESLQKQTYADFDVFIQFDGLIDADVAFFLENIQDERFVVFKRMENYGLADSLNELLVRALENRYLYFARMDIDDICLPYRFEKQVNYLKHFSSVDILGGYIEEFSLKGTTIVKYPLCHTAMHKTFAKRNPLAHMTVMFRRTYFEKAGLYPTDTEKDEDTMFWLKGFLSDCCFANIPELLVNVRVSDEFYKRRTGIKKSLSDCKNRCLIIRELDLNLLNYLFVFARFVVFLVPFPGITRIVYKLFRK